MSDRVHVLFVIRSLGRGGAERQLVTLARLLTQREFDVTIAVFYPGGALTKELQGTAVRLVELDKGGRWDLVGFAARLVRVARDVRPDVIHGYMGSANELCLMLGRVLRVPVVWGIRASYLDLSGPDWVPRGVFRVGAWLSSFPEMVVFNSAAGHQYHLEQGFRPQRVRVIANGIDTTRFKPDPAARRELREQWAVDDDEILIGLVGRIDPMKDVACFVDAAAQLGGSRSEVSFVVVGDGDPQLAAALRSSPAALQLGTRLRWESARPDIERLYAALDISTSTSRGEGFSNAIAEAMATGVPMVVTDVGDSAWIVENTGEVIRPESSVAVVEGWVRLLGRIERDGSERVGAAARRRIVDDFGVERLGDATGEMLREVVRTAKGGV